VKYEPYGVVGALITWNGPVINASMKLAPALAAGNCVVLKSPEFGPFAVMRLAELMLQAGLPEGVVNVLSGGPATGQAIIRHRDVRKVSFTAGPSVAKEIMALAAQTRWTRRPSWARSSANPRSTASATMSRRPAARPG
jgi:aldehyde dehydrogenase (NAD+)